VDQDISRRHVAAALVSGFDVFTAQYNGRERVSMAMPGQALSTGMMPAARTRDINSVQDGTSSGTKNVAMINRRQILLTAAAAAAVPRVFSADSALNAAFDRIVDRRFTLSPETATAYGYDKDKYAGAKRLLDDRSLAGRAAVQRNNAKDLEELRAFDRARLSATDATSYDAVMYELEAQAIANQRFRSIAQVQAPYVVYQLGGAYRNIPDFLDSLHQIHGKSDAEAYIERLQAFAKALDQDNAAVRHDVAAGVKPPAFALDKTLQQLKALRDQSPAKSRLVQSLVERTAAQKIAGDWNARAASIYTKSVQPALDRQIELTRSVRANAWPDAGVWKLPDGEALYASALQSWTTSSLPPDEIHRIGLELVAELSSVIDAEFKAQSLTQGSVAQRLQALAEDARFLYPNTDDSRAKLLTDLNAQVAKVNALLPKFFGTLPKANVQVKRVPPTIEAGQTRGYYTLPALDGSRPGAYYINLRNLKELPRWSLPTLTYHETVPGHHLQLTLQAEANMHLLRKITGYSAYIEGWGLYAEQLADEMGLYKDDPFGRIGYLHSQLYRAVRLVLDTALHAKRWTREQAIRYYMDTVGEQESLVVTEVERYCVWPGQACTYMLGKLTWTKLRKQAETHLGPRFDLRQFHDTGLLCGAVPLTVLERIVGDSLKSA
jgi:uncharacterized protein (DUF885 family)